MIVKFYIPEYESDEYEVPDDISDYELEQQAYQFLDDNATVEYEIMPEDDE